MRRRITAPRPLCLPGLGAGWGASHGGPLDPRGRWRAAVLTLIFVAALPHGASWAAPPSSAPPSSGQGAAFSGQGAATSGSPPGADPADKATPVEPAATSGTASDASRPSEPGAAPETSPPPAQAEGVGVREPHDGGAEDAMVEDVAAPTATPPEDAPFRPRPPRIDGAFVGGTVGAGATFARVNDLATPSPMIGGVGLISAGDAVFPWLTIGVSFYGGGGVTGDQRVGHGGLLLDVGLLPAPKRAPFSFRVGAGFGAGAVRDADETARFGFGGALFRGGVRYEFFPTAEKHRPNRGGGWSIGPELTWLGETPAAAGRPMANTILLGLWTGFYFGS